MFTLTFPLRWRRQTCRLIVDSVVFQLFWLATMLAPLPVWQLPALLLWAWLSPFGRRQWLIALVLASLGIMVDGLWLNIGWLSLTEPAALVAGVPLWLALLWLACCRYLLMLVASVRWPLWALSLFGALGGPASYAAAAAFGHASIHWSQLVITLPFVAWWALLPLLVHRLGETHDPL
ncbi:Protein of unknown function [Ferrimonas sediminum]|uniref:DUF2878 domain-containing protein n=1 Tax=Ferrimonas sediminum TaxID=718193 RepID=A0A1G8Q9Z4_9GAMM|nr:DUF2878 family protein [Ferrimonas sediminum]SDJ01592.1 Protein of unknown function [Ferrimonas sediminum]